MLLFNIFKCNYHLFISNLIKIKKIETVLYDRVLYYVQYGQKSKVTSVATSPDRTGEMPHTNSSITVSAILTFMLPETTNLPLKEGN
jgi:hypothetical protein